jgi:hypothetical protein
MMLHDDRRLSPDGGSNPRHQLGKNQAVDVNDVRRPRGDRLDEFRRRTRGREPWRLCVPDEFVADAVALDARVSAKPLDYGDRRAGACNRNAPLRQCLIEIEQRRRRFRRCVLDGIRLDYPHAVIVPQNF